MIGFLRKSRQTQWILGSCMGKGISVRTFAES